MSGTRGKEIPGPDIWAIGAGWLALVFCLLTINLWAWKQNYGDVWVIRGAIVTLACALTWVFGYWPRIAAGFRGWTKSGGLNVTVVTIGVIVAAVAANYLLHRYHWQRDLTKNRRFTLSDRSTQILRGLDKPVQATAFYSNVGRNRQQADTLLRQYKDASAKFKYVLVDPLERRQLHEEKKMETIEGIVFEYGSRTQQTAEVSEKEWTTSLLKLTREKQPKVFFLQGHGEMATEAGSDARRSLSTFKELLTSAQWQTEGLTLYGPAAKTPDPKETAVIVIADPVKPLMPEEEKKLAEYLKKGGRILAMVSPGGPDLKAIAQPYAIEVGNDLIYHPRFRDQVIVMRPESHEITRNMEIMVLLGARSVAPATKPPTGVSPTSLIKSDSAYSEIPNYKKGQPVDLGAPGVKAGSKSLAVVATKTGEGGAPESRVLVVGSAMSFSDAVLQQARQYFNQDFIANCVNWLGDQADLVSIEAKDPSPENLPVTAQHTVLLALIYWLEFPLLAIALGIYVYLKRR